MSGTWKARLDGALRRGEVAGLYFTTALLVVVEFCFVCWLNRIPIPDVPTAGAPGSLFCRRGIGSRASK